MPERETAREKSERVTPSRFFSLHESIWDWRQVQSMLDLKLISPDELEEMKGEYRDRLRITRPIPTRVCITLDEAMMDNVVRAREAGNTTVDLVAVTTIDTSIDLWFRPCEDWQADESAGCSDWILEPFGPDQLMGILMVTAGRDPLDDGSTRRG